MSYRNGTGRECMGWNRRYAIISYLRSSLWTVPLFALVVEQIGVRFLILLRHSIRPTTF